MKRYLKNIAIFCCFILFFQVCIVKGDVFTDSFDSAHNYLTQGVTGTGWNGFVGFGAVGSVDALNADTMRAGKFYIVTSSLRPYLRLCRQGNKFYHEVSDDGISWDFLSESPKTREGMNGLVLQKNGLKHESLKNGGLSC